MACHLRFEKEGCRSKLSFLPLDTFKNQTEAHPCQQERSVWSHHVKWAHIYRSLTSTSCCFPLAASTSQCIPPGSTGSRQPSLPHPVGDPGAPPGASGHQVVCALACLVGPAKLGTQRPDHITGPDPGSGWGRPPTPSLFAKHPSFACTGSRKAVTSCSRNCQQTRAEKHESEWVTGCLWFFWPYKSGLWI
jgi:hypothetical protein